MALVALVIVADEVLSGRTTEGNGAWLAGRLAARGASLAGIEVVPDREEVIADAVTRAARRAPLVVVSGGLGPTEDDRTREGLARAAGRPLAEDPAARALVESALAARGRAWSAAHGRQALLPEGAAPLLNPAGTAPGVRLALAGATVLALPGLPEEFRVMASAEVLPRLEGPPAEVRSVWVAGIAEAEIAARLVDLARVAEPSLGSYPEDGEVEIRITARGPDAAARAEAAAREVRARLGADALPAEGVARSVVGLLSARRWRLVTAESVTGGAIARLVTEVPGASDIFSGGWVTYKDAWKEQFLGVSPVLLARHGAVSEPVAQAMAEGAQRRGEADVALATTGSAGPGSAPGPRGPVPPGTAFVAVALRGGACATRAYLLPGLSRAAFRRRVAVHALDLLRRRLEAGGG